MLRLSKIVLLLVFTHYAFAQSDMMHGAATEPGSRRSPANLFLHPPEDARPWVFWYWMQGAVSKEGIHADLAAMKQAGIGGAYLMPINGPAKPPVYTPVVEQLSPLWWEMVKYAMTQADSLGLKIAMHYCDGFAVGGGPWITPALSMQKVVWTETVAVAADGLALPQPETNEGYYEDISVLAFPEPASWTASTKNVRPIVTTSTGADAGFLAVGQRKESFKSDTVCWIQYAFERPFTCRTIRIFAPNNYQSQRLLVEVSDDGVSFRSLGRLTPPRHGWEDGDAAVTHVIPTTTAKYFRFVYDRKESEPGSEDVDAAKWKPSLKVTGIELSAAPGIENIEGKNGEMWRLSAATSSAELPDSLCIDPRSVVDVTSFMDAGCHLHWKAPGVESVSASALAAGDSPAGSAASKNAAVRWIVLRIGHTSTGHTNATGGGGKGLECDKFNPEAIRLQWDRWYGEALRQAGPALAKKVLKIFHVDSWECGSQNWSPVFRDEFRRRRGYDLAPWLPVMAGVPLGSVEKSEKVLRDVRQTIAELLHDGFYTQLAGLAHAAGCQFSAESVAPTMMSDGLLHFDEADLPMGEFWLRSPTHDKPNDVLDAISGAHIYGKNIVQAEAFTELKEAWDEYPGLLKTLQDRNYALGINRLVFHVFVHNPWMNRKPGMTLGGVGTYLQRDQTWWKYAGAWIDYTRRCQALLQWGHPVTDIAVFTGEELPRRAVLPERLTDVLPGLIGADRIEREHRRLANAETPVTKNPNGVSRSANMADPAEDIDWLNGYAFDSFNPDALLRLASVKDGRVVFPGGASYALLVFSGKTPMTPNAGQISDSAASRILMLVKDGANILVDTNVVYIASAFRELLAGSFDASGVAHVGKGRVIAGPLTRRDALDVEADLLSDRPSRIAWAHRAGEGSDIYFVSNQQDSAMTVTVSLRVRDLRPEVWDPVSGEMMMADWKAVGNRTEIRLKMAEHGSCFIVLRRGAAAPSTVAKVGSWKELKGSWRLRMGDRILRLDSLQDWSLSGDTLFRYYSGTATYTRTFMAAASGHVQIDLGSVANVARVWVNGTEAGTLWTPPFVVTAAVHAGKNELKIEVANTWFNRLTGDQRLAPEARTTFTVVPFAGSGRLQPAGLLGPVRIAVKN